MAHLFCETHARLDAVELVKDGRFPFPLSQTELADMLGLSPVHVNRTLMGLRGAGLIEWRDKTLEIRDLGRLTRLAEFDPAYLRLWKEPV
jgi:CRP-like cAMP-binding protein